jgi:hypothetical protein
VRAFQRGVFVDGHAANRIFRHFGASSSKRCLLPATYGGIRFNPYFHLFRDDGLEMIGALGDNERFGFYWRSQQHYLGPVFTYDFSSHWSVRLEPALGLSKVSDPFMLRMGVAFMFGSHQ